MSTPLRAALALWSILVPGDFREALVGDVVEGFARERRRGRRRAALWLLTEMARTPYLGLWRQSRRGVPSRATGSGSRQPKRRWGDGMGTTLKIAARMLVRRPGFAGVAVATLALSVGAATLIFGLLNAVLLQPLPYPQPDRLYQVYGTNTAWRDGDQAFLKAAWDRAPISATMAEAWREQGAVQVGTFQPGSRTTRVAEGPAEPLSGALVGAHFFETLGVQPLLGRLPTADEVAAAQPVVVIHESLWARDFGRDPEVVGQTLELDGTPYTVVGVMPRTFALPAQGTRWWAPFPQEFADYADATVLSAVVRLGPDATASSAAEAMNAVVDNLATAEPAYEPLGARIVPLREEVLGSVSDGLRLLFAAVCVVVLIACVNLANLVVARGARRMPELAVRAALGAGRGGLVGAVLTEVGLLCLVGVALGVGIAALTLGPLVSFLTAAMPDFPRAQDVSLSLPVLAFAVGVMLLTAVLAGLLPALSVARRAPAEYLRAGKRSGRSLGIRRTQAGLLFAEAGLAMLLLVGAGLLTRSMAHALRLDPGFDSRGIAYLSLQFPEGRFPDDADVVQALGELEGRLARVPQVAGVVEARPLPSLSGNTMTPVRPAGAPADQAGMVLRPSVGPGYFRALSIPLLEGRGFEPADGPGAPPVAVVSASLARQLFGDEDAIGRVIVAADGAVLTGARADVSKETSMRIVGVVGEVRQLAVVREAEPVLYRPFRQSSLRYPTLAVTTEGDPGRALESVRAAAAEQDGVVIDGVGVYRRQTFHILAPVQLRTVLLAALAGLAAVLAMVGIYGVVSYVVSDQRREIGIRMALGARAGSETGRMIGQALLPSLAGAALGLAVASAVSRVLESSIFEISHLDPLTYALAFSLLVAVATMAAWWPARRAARVEPVTALNED